MQNQEFMTELDTLLWDLLGSYTSETVQRAALTFHDQPRDRSTLRGLEVVSMPVYRDQGIGVGYTDAHQILMQQHDGSQNESIYLAVDRLIHWADQQGAYRTKTIWSDADSDLLTKKQVQVFIWLAQCPCDYDLCDQDLTPPLRGTW